MTTVALVTDIPFWLQGRGDRCRIDALCRSLARHLRLTLLFIGEAPTGLAERLRAELGVADTRVIATRRGPVRSATPGGEPRLSDFEDADVARDLADLLAEVRPDAILVEYIRLAYLAKACRSASPEASWLMDTLDVMSERCRQFHAVGERHWIAISENEEREALAPFDAVLGIQDADSALFRKMLPEKTVITVGHAVDIVEHPARTQPLVQVLFVGTAGAPNRLALAEFLKNVWPAVAAALPGHLALWIAGEVGAKLDPHALPAGVTRLGVVELMAPLYAATDIVVNPVTFGGGLKIKSVEALCHGKPLITTSAGALGLETGVGTAFRVCDDSAAFEAALVELIRSPEARMTLGQAAHAYAAGHFSEEAAYGPLRDYLREATVAGGVRAL